VTRRLGLAALGVGLGVGVGLGLGLGLGACKKSEPPPPPPPAAAIPQIEVKRAQDACKAYVDKVCACARSHPDLADSCKLARALPDALQVSLEVGSSGDSTRRDVLQTQDSVRKIAKECIEELARLPAGC
jgi:hypothetical protein